MESADTFTHASLDLGVGERQAFGISYGRPDQLETQLSRLREGVIKMPPHGEWKGDFTDWSANPFQDRNWQFQFHTLRWTSALRWAAIEGDATARDQWLEIARSWSRENIPAEKSPSIFAWKDMADGNRAIQLSIGAALAGEADGWFIKSLEYHRDWLMDPARIVPKNHGLHQHTGLLVVGATLRDRHATDTAVDRMTKQFLTAFDAQGTNDEGSVGYHQLNLKWWGQAWRRAELEGYQIPGDVSRRLSAGALALAHMAMPDGQMPQIGDTARGSVATGMGPATDFVASGGNSGRAPTDTVFVMTGGYAASRSGWGEQRALPDESHTLIRHGEDMKAHSHADRGSVHIYTRGKVWLTDSGFHSYQLKDPIRQYLNSRLAHNVAFAAGVRHDDSAPVDLVSHFSSEDVHDFTMCDRGYEGFTLERRVIYFPAPDCWLILDSSSGSDSIPLVQHWHLEPGAEAWYRDNGFRLRQGAETMNLTWLGSRPQLRLHSATEGNLEAWIGTRWKTLKPSKRISATLKAAVSPAMITLIHGNSPHPLGIVDSRKSSSGDLTLTVVRGTGEWRIQVTKLNASIDAIGEGS